MKITKQWLQEQNACTSGIEWFLKQRASKLDTVIMRLLKENHFDWASWVIVRFMSHAQKVVYAAFAAKQVLHFFEKKYPNDKRPREAIEAALRFAYQPAPENRGAAFAAANTAAYVAANTAAYAAANTAYVAAPAYVAANAAYAAANAAADAAYAAANAAYAAAYAAANTAYASTNASTYAAANAATYAAANAAPAMKKKIIIYGLKLIKNAY